jgi:hypothetical protein
MSSGDLVSWEQVKSILGLDDDAEEEAAFLIASASAQAEQTAGRFLSARDVSITLDGSGGREILLPSYPVNSVGRICVDTERAFPADKDLDERTCSVRYNAGIVRLYYGVFPRQLDCVLFEGSLGYDPVPADLRQAVIETVSANMRRFSASGGLVGIKSISAQGAITTNYEIDVPLSARNVFLSYRRIVI